MPEDDLILPRRIWMRTYQDGCGLPALPDSFLEGLKVISLLTNAISDKGALKEFGIERDNSLPIDHSQARLRHFIQRLQHRTRSATLRIISSGFRDFRWGGITLDRCGHTCQQVFSSHSSLLN